MQVLHTTRFQAHVLPLGGASAAVAIVAACSEIRSTHCQELHGLLLKASIVLAANRDAAMRACDNVQRPVANALEDS